MQRATRTVGQVQVPKHGSLKSVNTKGGKKGQKKICEAITSKTYLNLKKFHNKSRKLIKPQEQDMSKLHKDI